MATRIYPVIPGSAADTAPDISPTPHSSWEKTTGFDRIRGLTSSPTGTGSGTIDITGTGSNPNDILHFQVISGPWAAQNLTGDFKSVWRTREFNAGTNARAQVNVRAFSLAGAELAVLIAHDTSALSNEFVNGTLETRRFPVGYTGSGVAVSNGNIAEPFYLVAEFGARVHSTDTSNDVRLTHSDTSAGVPDASETEGSTTAPAFAWMEISDTLSPYVTATGAAATATGAANTAKTTIAPSPGAATATGAAYDATVSFLTPPRSVVIAGTDYTDKIRFNSFNFVECANRGEVGIGGFDVDDATNSLDIPALKAVTFEEPAAGTTNKWIFTGYTQQRQTERGPNQAAGQRQWGVEVVDLNTLADDYVLTDAESADRPAETDYVRVAWLLTSRLNSVGGVGVGVVPNTNTVNMDASDYRGRTARDVLNECSEMAGKNWFIYCHDGTADLFYDLSSGSNLTTDSRISDDPADVDSSTTWAVVGPPRLSKNPDRVYSTVHLTYTGGTVSVSNATTASNYRTREYALIDTSVDTSAKATAKANAFLAAAAAELIRVEQVAVVVPAANVNDFRAGHLFDLKLTRHGITDFTPYRIIRREVTALNDVRYRVTLTLSDGVLPTIFSSQRGGDVYGIWEKKSNATDDGATVTIDRNGLNVIDGAITVVNSGGTTIIDGSQDILRIAGTGTYTITGPDGDPTAASTGTEIDVATGLTEVPPIITYNEVSGESYEMPYLGVLNGTATVREVRASYAAVVNTDETRVRTFWWANIDRSSDSRDIRFYILDQAAF